MHAQVPSSIIFVQKMAQRCGVWQTKHMTSLDQDQVSMKSNMFGFGELFTNEVLKMPEIVQEGMFWVWFGLVMSRLSHLLGLDPF